MDNPTSEDIVLQRMQGLLRSATKCMFTLLDVASGLFLWFMLILFFLFVLAIPIGGIIGGVWMWRHEGPMSVLSMLLISAIMVGLLERGFHLSDKAERERLDVETRRFHEGSHHDVTAVRTD